MTQTFGPYITNIHQSFQFTLQYHFTADSMAAEAGGKGEAMKGAVKESLVSVWLVCEGYSMREDGTAVSKGWNGKRHA